MSPECNRCMRCVHIRTFFWEMLALKRTSRAKSATQRTSHELAIYHIVIANSTINNNLTKQSTAEFQLEEATGDDLQSESSA